MKIKGMENPEQIPKKKWYASRVVWFNIFTSVLMATEYITPLGWVAAPILLGINVVGNLALRLFFTTQPIAPIMPKPIPEKP